MVGVTKIQRGNAGYWLAAVAEGGEDYYQKPGEAPGGWIGELAADLGLSGQVEAEAYSAILEGTDPTSGKQLVRRPDTKFRERPDGTQKRVEPVLGYDVRFSAPKSVSILYALGDEATRARVVSVVNDAVRQGLARARDIDFEANLIAVERGWDQVEGVIEPKSRAGRRSVPLLTILRDYLDEHLRRTGRSDDDLVFGRTARQAFYASTVDGRAKRAWTRANKREHEAAEDEGRESDPLKPISLHLCRHTFASLLIDAGANPKAIQEFMGHSKIQTTFDVYGHLLPGSRDEVRERMDAYLAVH